MANFDAGTVSTVGDFELAEAVHMGLPIEVQNLITNHQLLLASPFVYSDFEFRLDFRQKSIAFPLLLISFLSAFTQAISHSQTRIIVILLLGK
ncbi:hypothetical protein H4Q26_016271 [Puccinia striiformis f. sp. tritici PST-130]|nr:hypothetical protein H4Q26_016271 [Puccinia striiformis f. sp. tritici PST-130]